MYKFDTSKVRSASKKTCIAAGILAIGMTLAFAGCGSSTNSSNDASAGSADTSASAALLKKYSGEPEFLAPGPPFDARGLLQGKKIMSIPVSSQIPIVSYLVDAGKQAASEVGFTYKVWQNQGNKDQWIQGINQAISQEFDVIDLLAIDPASLKPQIEEARAAGIKVISSHFAGMNTPVPGYIDGAVRLPYYEVGRLQAAWAVVETKGKADVLAVVANDLASTGDVVKGIKDEFAKNCDACKLKIVNSPTVNWDSQVQGLVSSNIQQNPNINFVLPIYDAMAPKTVAALRLTEKTKSVGIATFNGTPAVLDLVAQKKISMDIGENEEWIGLAMIDQDMRAAAGLDVLKDTYKSAPLRVFSQANVGAAGSPAQASAGYGNAYQTGFKTLWGLTK